MDGSQRTSAEDCICASIYVYDPVVKVNQSQKILFQISAHRALEKYLFTIICRFDLSAQFLIAGI